MNKMIWTRMKRAPNQPQGLKFTVRGAMSNIFFARKSLTLCADIRNPILCHCLYRQKVKASSGFYHRQMRTIPEIFLAISLRMNGKRMGLHHCIVLTNDNLSPPSSSLSTIFAFIELIVLKFGRI